ncbi:hypothetical protein MVG78_09015 [Roseomonas gilardii subsp. gilardii]|uniref:flagellin N-terminal helical domain-containing protein n=1 Tax=Roseomonas gilardii TaxID=257708 RepID=UPI001FF9824C|nr:flagellin [Roseomonas gilardii]UPG74241.1 hypothetical protein MVG78_09015 [Roseomonas gilardii subsp. gilardii]
MASVTNTGASGTLSRILLQSLAQRDRVNLLSQQSSSGRVASLYGDEAPQARQAISLRGEIGRRAAYTEALNQASGRADASQQALTQLSDIASEFRATVLSLNSSSATRASDVAVAARAAMQQVATLLNAQYAGEYLFSGADSANPAVTDASGIAGSGMMSGVATAVAGLDSDGAASVLSQAMQAMAADSPFSAYLQSASPNAARSVAGADGRTIAYGVPAGSLGATGWAGALMGNLAVLASLTDDQQSSANFDALVQQIANGFDSVGMEINRDASRIGLAQNAITTALSSHSEATDALKTQLSGLEEVDFEATIATLQNAQTQLEASWKVLSMLSGLSLTNFLS